MPVLEAMACGCPVVTCANSSLIEVGGDAAIFVDPDDAKGAAACGDVLVGPADARGARGGRHCPGRDASRPPAQARDALAAFRATIDGLAAGRRALPGNGWREFRTYQAGIQGWLQRRPDLATEALSQAATAGAPAAPAKPSGELLRAWPRSRR